jgi:catechol 2,3-dioxygenase-like lactoylglutathione lyase family enzyme
VGKKLGHLEIFVHDMEISRAFYTALGFQHEASQGPNLTWMKLGDREILLRKNGYQSGAAAYGAGGPALVVYTDDLEATVKGLKTAGFVQSGCDNGDECCPLFRDPSGNWVQIVDPGDHT